MDKRPEPYTGSVRKENTIHGQVRKKLED